MSFVHKKETEHSFELSLSICVFYRRIFNLESKTLVYKTTTWWTRASHFVDGWHLLRCQIRFFLSWLTWPLDVCGKWSMGDSTDLVWEFFPKPLGLKIFSPRHNGVRFFFRILRHEGYFFQCRIFFPRILFACFFSLKISLQDIFRESLITPSKFKWSAPKIHQTFSQLTDSDLQIISKGFWNNRGQNSLEERGGIRFYLPLTGESVRWRHN